MILDCTQYDGLCSCGRTHTVTTKKVVIESGCFNNMDQYLKEIGLTGRRTIIYDTNTYKLTAEHPRADQQIILEAKGLSTTKERTEAMMAELESPDFLVSVGSGTITDFARYSAYQLGIPFVCVPTVASADGFTANICSIIIDGKKCSIPMNAAELVLCDLDILSGAPAFLMASGICDILAKYVSLADWRIAHLVTGEFYCERVAEMAEDALHTMLRCAHDLLDGKPADIEAMTYAQMISGLTMQMLSNSRAASGSEHLMAHLVEMKPPRFEQAAGIHGECVGVGTILAAEEYHRMAAMTPKAKAFQPLDPAWVAEKFGPLADVILAENANDVLATFDPQQIVDHWDEIRAIVDTIPQADDLRKLYADLGAKYRLEDLHIDPSLKEDVLDMSAAIRNRLTLMRMRRVLEF